MSFNWFEEAQVVSILLGCFLIGAYRSSHFTPVGGNRDKIFYWWEGLGWTGVLIIRILNDSSPYVSAMFAAYCFYRWWNAGGGDGIKNFLQSLVMKPAHAVR
ncbi:hypothetical protein SEA_MOAB_242 [Streptomyces phage Moab]|nr:hypothetical protein SEA_MOAB_242 [Streptomyces phage Moab]